MATPSPSELIVAADMAKMAGLMPFLEEQVNRAMDRIEAQAEQALQNGGLTPERAQSMWIEYLTYRRIYRGFAQRAAYGAEVGAKIGTDPVPQG